MLSQPVLHLLRHLPLVPYLVALWFLISLQHLARPIPSLVPVSLSSPNVSFPLSFIPLQDGTRQHVTSPPDLWVWHHLLTYGCEMAVSYLGFIFYSQLKIQTESVSDIVLVEPERLMGMQRLIF